MKDLTASKTYVFRARCKNSIGWSEHGPLSVPFYLNFVPPPGQPTKIQTSTQWITIEWLPPCVNLQIEKTEIHCKRIIHSDNEEDQQEEYTPLNLFTAHKGITNQKIDGLRPNTSYIFSCRVMTVLGWSGWSYDSDPICTMRRK